MRDKTRELSAPMPKRGEPKAHNENGKPVKTHISIKAFPTMNKIIIYLAKGGSGDQLTPLERDLRSYFSANREKYRIEKATPEKEGE